MCLGVEGTPHYKVASECEIPKTVWFGLSGTGRQSSPTYLILDPTPGTKR